MSERDVMNHGSSLHLATGEPHRARAMPTRPLLAAATAVIAVGCAHAKPQSSPEPSMSSPVSTQTVANQPAPIQAADLARTTVRGQAATVEVEMGFDAATGTVDVRYRLRNNDPAKPLAVFDRGNRHEVSIGRQTLGAIAAPTWKGMGEEVELFHVAAPLPNPRPISPPSPLALEVAAGGELRVQVRVAQRRAQALALVPRGIAMAGIVFRLAELDRRGKNLARIVRRRERAGNAVHALVRRGQGRVRAVTARVGAGRCDSFEAAA
jgi:hypothetical protein